ncbi:MAG: RDD family protein [Methylotenera sp.]|nr:RDD family protein [Methylotenera sp.]
MLALRPAGLVARSMAFLIDLLIRLSLYVGIAIAFGALGGFGMSVILVSMFCIEWLYPIVFELSRWGATPGKRSYGLRVVMDTGLPITPAASFTRNLVRVADFLPLAYGIGLVTMLLNGESKRLGDLAAGTLVVHAEPVVLHDAPPAAEPMAPARALSATEQAAILSWAGRTRRLTPARLEELAQLASPLLPATADEPKQPATPRLLGVAQWLMGKRA